MVRVGVRVHSLVTGPALCFTVFLIESAKGAPRPLPASILRVYGVCMCVVCVCVCERGVCVCGESAAREEERERALVSACLHYGCVRICVCGYIHVSATHAQPIAPLHISTNTHSLTDTQSLASLHPHTHSLTH